MLAASGRHDEQATGSEPQFNAQGEGGISRRKGREGARRVGATV